MNEALAAKVRLNTAFLYPQLHLQPRAGAQWGIQAAPIACE